MPHAECCSPDHQEFQGLKRPLYQTAEAQRVAQFRSRPHSPVFSVRLAVLRYHLCSQIHANTNTVGRPARIMVATKRKSTEEGPRRKSARITTGLQRLPELQVISRSFGTYRISNLVRRDYNRLVPFAQACPARSKPRKIAGRVDEALRDLDKAIQDAVNMVQRRCDALKFK